MGHATGEVGGNMVSLLCCIIIMAASESIFCLLFVTRSTD